MSFQSSDLNGPSFLHAYFASLGSHHLLDKYVYISFCLPSNNFVIYMLDLQLLSATLFFSRHHSHAIPGVKGEAKVSLQSNCYYQGFLSSSATLVFDSSSYFTCHCFEKKYRLNRNFFGWWVGKFPPVGYP